jgi:phage gpG-like protein
MNDSLAKLLQMTQQGYTTELRPLYVNLAKQAQNYFASSWRKQGFDGVSWKEVKRREPNENAYKYPKKGGAQRRTSPILIGAGLDKHGGTLRRAVSNMSNSTKYRTNGIIMTVNLPYAKIHNEGGKGKAFGKYTFNMPKRQFVGQTRELTEKQLKLIKTEIDKIFTPK